MVRASIAALLGMSIFAGAQVASAQNAVSEEEIKCFVSGCDEAKAADDAEAKADDEDECMTSGICPVGETRGFHLSTGAPAKQVATRPGASSSRTSSGSAPRYAASSGSKVAGKASGTSRLAMPATRKSLDMRLSFEMASATLTPAARAQADVFARQLKDAAGTRQFVIEGHTDNVGSAAYNRQLSRERAQSVVTYLVGQGVPASKLRAVGYGFDHPRDGTTAADASNRRVEIVRY